jgi:hypothetical protein
LNYSGPGENLTRPNEPKLRWNFNFDESSLPKESYVQSFLDGKEWVRKNYPLMEYQTGKLVYPYAPDNHPVEDFLLITRVDNNRTPLAETHGSKFVLAYGSHGAGTASFGLLLSNTDMLENLVEQTRGRNFQAIYRVLVKDDLGTKTTKPYRIEPFDEDYIELL